MIRIQHISNQVVLFDYTTPSHYHVMSTRSILYHLRMDLPCGVFPPHFPTKA